MKRHKVPPLTVIVDTREIKPFSFAGTGFYTTKKRLETGDYTIKGLESRLCIERKGAVEELYTNLVGNPRERERQRKAFGRMLAFPYRYLFLEASSADLLQKNPFSDTPPEEFAICFWNTMLEFDLVPIFLGKRSGKSHQQLWIFLRTFWHRWCHGDIE